LVDDSSSWHHSLGFTPRVTYVNGFKKSALSAEDMDTGYELIELGIFGFSNVNRTPIGDVDPTPLVYCNMPGVVEEKTLTPLNLQGAGTSLCTRRLSLSEI